MTVLRTRDLVPAALRAWWAVDGCYPSLDLFTLFERHARAHPNRAAVIDDDGVINYHELYDSATRLAGALYADGVRPGEVLAVQLPNDRRAVIVDLAAAAIGAVVLAFPVGRGWRDTATLLGRSRASVAVVLAGNGEHSPAETLARLRPDLPHLRTVLVAGAHGSDSLEGWIDDGAPTSRRPAVDPAGPARILVSSGSEASPKMVVYSHDALTGGRGEFVGLLQGGRDPMRNLFLVPLASSFGSSGTAVTIARHGGTLIVTARFEPGGALEAIHRHRPYLVFGVPTMFAKMLDHPRLAEVDVSSLRAVVSGGSRVDPGTVEACRLSFGCVFVNCYGSADGVNCVTDPQQPPSDVHARVGRPNIRVAAIRIVCENGSEAAPGEIGEIWGLGPMSPMCYVDADFDSRYRAEGGWVRTGDLGRIDAEGYLHVEGRLAEYVIRGGLNISPVEVELLIAQHPAVCQVACVGVPDALLGERLAAAISVRCTSAPPSLAELCAYLEHVHGLERAKLPERLAIFPELPLSPAGKIDKRCLREQLASPASTDRSCM